MGTTGQVTVGGNGRGGGVRNAALPLASMHHCQGMNKPAFFKQGYLPKIDAMYRGQVRVTSNFSESPGGTCVVQGRFRRPC
jgi:hypothetical protein